MKVAQVQSRCECQATLLAEVREDGLVLGGAARRGRSEPETAPATRVGAPGAQINVGWLCPMCGRNVMRPIDLGGLAFVERAEAAAVD